MVAAAGALALLLLSLAEPAVPAGGWSALAQAAFRLTCRMQIVNIGALSLSRVHGVQTRRADARAS